MCISVDPVDEDETFDDRRVALSVRPTSRVALSPLNLSRKRRIVCSSHVLQTQFPRDFFVASSADLRQGNLCQRDNGVARQQQRIRRIVHVKDSRSVAMAKVLRVEDLHLPVLPPKYQSP